MIHNDSRVAQFAFAKKHNMRFYFVSAADGTNVVKVCCANSI